MTNETDDKSQKLPGPAFELEMFGINLKYFPCLAFLNTELTEFE